MSATRAYSTATAVFPFRFSLARCLGGRACFPTSVNCIRCTLVSTLPRHPLLRCIHISSFFFLSSRARAPAFCVVHPALHIASGSPARVQFLRACGGRGQRWRVRNTTGSLKASATRVQVPHIRFALAAPGCAHGSVLMGTVNHAKPSSSFPAHRFGIACARVLLVVV